MAGQVLTNGGRPVYAYESITVSTTAIGITSTLVTKMAAAAPTKNASYALITVEGDAVRYRLDGVDPTASEGHKLAVADVLLLDNFDDIRRFRAIRVTTDGTLKVSLS